MTVTVAWDNPQKTILCIRCEGRWSWRVYRQNEALAWRMVDEVDHPVILVIHVVDLAAARPPRDAFNVWSSSMDDSHMNKVSKVVLVSDVALIRALVIISQKIFSRDKIDRFCVVKTLDEARALVAQS